MRNDLTVNRNTVPSIWNIPVIDEMFERAFRNPLSLLDEYRVTPTMDREWFHPNIDVEEREDAFFLNVDLPGVKRDDVKVDLTDNILTISGERKRQNELAKFQRSFTLPSTVDATKVEARMEDGVLSIALPKSEAGKPRTIQVQ